MPDYLTAAVRALIGYEAPPVEATHPVEASEVRRFHHATHGPGAALLGSGVGRRPTLRRRGGAAGRSRCTRCAARRRAATRSTATTSAGSAATAARCAPGCRRSTCRSTRLLNGGYEYELFRYARLGERIVCRSRYQDIYQRDGASGPMVFVVLEDRYATSEGEPLLTVDQHDDPAMRRRPTRRCRSRTSPSAIELPPIVIGPITPSHLVRWAAAMENWHRIHFDWRYATGARRPARRGRQRLVEAARAAAPGHRLGGGGGWLWKIAFQFRAMNVPGETLTAWGARDGDRRARRLRPGRGSRSASPTSAATRARPGTAVTVWPTRDGPPVPYPFDPRVVEGP